MNNSPAAAANGGHYCIVYLCLNKALCLGECLSLLRRHARTLTLFNYTSQLNVLQSFNIKDLLPHTQKTNDISTTSHSP